MATRAKRGTANSKSKAYKKAWYQKHKASILAKKKLTHATKMSFMPAKIHKPMKMGGKSTPKPMMSGMMQMPKGNMITPM